MCYATLLHHGDYWKIRYFYVAFLFIYLFIYLLRLCWGMLPHPCTPHPSRHTHTEAILPKASCTHFTQSAQLQLQLPWCHIGTIAPYTARKLESYHHHQGTHVSSQLSSMSLLLLLLLVHRALLVNAVQGRKDNVRISAPVLPAQPAVYVYSC